MKSIFLVDYYIKSENVLYALKLISKVMIKSRNKKGLRQMDNNFSKNQRSPLDLVLRRRPNSF